MKVIKSHLVNWIRSFNKRLLHTQRSQGSLPTFLVVLLISIGGGLTLRYATPDGLGLRDDSFTYISGAETIADSMRYGRIYPDETYKPITNFPPGYSISLAILRILGIDIYIAAELLNLFLFSLLILIGGYGIFLITQSSTMSIIGSVLILTSEVFTYQFSWALSEPLFLIFILLATLLLHFFICSQEKVSYLVTSSIFLSLGSLTRYAGISFVLSAAIIIMIYRETKLLNKVRETLLLVVLAIGPLFLFGLRNVILTGNLSNRPQPHLHSPATEVWVNGGKTMLRWFLPDRFIDSLGSIEVYILLFTSSSILLVLLFYLFEFYKHQSVALIDHPSLLTRLIIINIATYFAFLIVTVLFLDRLTPLNNRILSPIHLLALILITQVFHQISTRQRPWERIFLITTVVLFVGFQSYREFHLLKDLNRDGQGYASSTWRESETLRYICGKQDVPIYSNDLPAIYFHCHRFAKSIPYPVNLASQEANDEYNYEIILMREEIMNNDALVAFIGWYGDKRLERLGFVEVVKGMTLIKTFDDGLIYSK